MNPPLQTPSSSQHTVPEQPVTHLPLDWEKTAAQANHPGYHQDSPPARPAGPSWQQQTPSWLTLKLRISSTYHRLSLRAKILILATVLTLLALILGLSIGLSRNIGNGNKALPLGSQTYTGDLTYYGPGLGACGKTSSSSDDIVSISHLLFDSASSSANPNANPFCGHKLRATRLGKSVDLTVVDRCTGCASTDLDVSPGAFDKLADPDLGRTSVQWAWLDPKPEAKGK